MRLHPEGGLPRLFVRSRPFASTTVPSGKGGWRPLGLLAYYHPHAMDKRDDPQFLLLHLCPFWHEPRVVELLPTR